MHEYARIYELEEDYKVICYPFIDKLLLPMKIKSLPLNLYRPY